MAKNVKHIKLFVSSPSDVVDERGKYMDQVVKDLNEGTALDHGMHVDLWRWETDAHPDAGRAQDIITKQLGEYEIYLGIMWKRFGTPTGRAKSGVEEEFNLAYRTWQKNRSLHILFYFCTAPCPLPKTNEDLEQAKKVLDFRKQLEGKLLLREYKSHRAFGAIVKRDLIKVIREMSQDRPKAKAIVSYGNQKGAGEKSMAKRSSARRQSVARDPISTIQWDESGKMAVRIPDGDSLFSSFVPGGEQGSKFLRLIVDTTPGFVQGKWIDSSIYLIRDPLRSCLIQIGETRSQRDFGNPKVVEELKDLGVKELEVMYPFISSSQFKWIRTVIAELSTKPDVLKYIHREDRDSDVRKTAARNPSAPEDLMALECPFCQAEFRGARRLKEMHARSQSSRIIRNDFPYGPFFHYIAFPAAPVHSWEEFTWDQLVDLNKLVWRFMKGKRGSTQSNNIDGSPGLNIGFNSTIRHLVLTRHSRASAGASIAHVHKQIWGMAPGSVCLSNHLTALCRAFDLDGIDYLDSYLTELDKQGFVIWEDEKVALYVPWGQTSVHELQVMVKDAMKCHYLDLTIEEVESLSKAEFLAIRIYKLLGVGSFNEVLITEDLATRTKTFRLVLTFITREVDLAVSELNHLYVVDKHPQDTVEAIIGILPKVGNQYSAGLNRRFGWFLKKDNVVSKKKVRST